MFDREDYGYDVVNGRLTMPAEDAIAINSSSNIASGRCYFDGTYRGVVAAPNGSTISRQKIGGTIRINADFINGTLSGSVGKLSVTGTVSPVRHFFSGRSTFVTDDGVQAGRASGTNGRSDLLIGFPGTDGDAGFVGGLMTGPLMSN